MNRPVLYIDTLFFLNLIINYLLLLAAARLSASGFSRGRLALGAVIDQVVGGIICITEVHHKVRETEK